MLLPPSLQLTLLDAEFAVCRLPAGSPVPQPPPDVALYSVTATADELSVVCPVAVAPCETPTERGWRVLKVKGPLDFSLVGILASVLDPLVDANVSVFAISTYETDYVLVKEEQLRQALTALKVANHRVEVPS